MKMATKDIKSKLWGDTSLRIIYCDNYPKISDIVGVISIKTWGSIHPIWAYIMLNQ